MSATEELVLAERHGAVLVLTLNRPERMNAWNNDLEDRYFALLDEAEDDSSVRAIVLTGAGRAFCAGADMANLQRIDQAAGRSARPRSRTFPRTLDKPLVAAINGAAAGLGLVEALCCDVRFCTPEAKLTTAFARRGLIAEYGLSWILPRLIGQGNAFDLALSGRIVLGEEAYKLGLVDRLVSFEGLLESAIAFAADLAESCSPLSMAIIKRQLRSHGDVDFATALAESDALMLASFDLPDVKEGVASYVERRPPNFSPLPPRDERSSIPGLGVGVSVSGSA
ncbi:MAG: enoyl-CoA hydratase-related protein [Solirubrobacteraceae bacterium]|jgi:enoyl-CoA hydratase/carnithine racemase